MYLLGHCHSNYHWGEERVYLVSKSPSQFLTEGSQEGTQAGATEGTAEEAAYWLVPLAHRHGPRPIWWRQFLS